MLVFDGNAIDYRVGLDNSGDKLELGVGSTMGTTTALTIDSNQQVKITATTPSTSTTTGSLVSAGGIGTAGNIISGGYGLFSGGIIPASSGGANLGSSSAEWLGLYLNDAAKIYMGDDQEVTITHNADTGIILSATTSATNGIKELLNLTHTTSGTPAAGIGSDIAFIVETSADNNEKGMILEALTTDVTSGQEDFDFVVKLMEGGSAAAERIRVTSAGNLTLPEDGTVMTFGTTDPVTLTHGTNELLISGSDKLAFGDNGTYIQQSSDGVLDLTSDGSINMNVGSSGVLIKGSNPKLTIGDAGEEDTMLVFDGYAIDYRVGLDNSSDKLEIGVGSSMGTITAMTIDSAQQVKITATTSSTSSTSGSLVTAGGVGIAGDLHMGGNVIIPDSGDIGSSTIPGAINISNTGLVDVSSLAIGGATITASASELNLVNGITAGTASASKAVILDSAKNITSLGTIGSGAITSTGNSSFGQITVDTVSYTHLTLPTKA